MQREHPGAAALRRSLLLIVALMAVSTVLFVVGVAIERRGEAAEGAAAHQEPAGEEEAGEAAESGEGEGAHEEAGSHEEGGEAAEHGEETILGVNPEAPWAVAAVVAGWTLLAAALLVLGPRVLILVALAAAASTVLDAMEVLRQLALADATVAILAALVALGHAAIAVLAVMVLRRYSASRPQGNKAV